MSMTITEKILAKHAGLKSVKPGDLVMAKVDIALGNDGTLPIALDEFEKIGTEEVFDKEGVVFVLDHFTPSNSVQTAQQCLRIRKFAEKYGIINVFDGGRVGIEHALLPEMGMVLPGYLVVGADSHTCTYGALGAFATGIGSTELASAMALGEIWLKVPETIRIHYYGSLGEWITGKDLVLNTIGRIGVDGALYKAIEFGGEVINQLSMDSRFTICNMVIEAGAKNGVMEPDEKTLEYVREVNIQNNEFQVFKSDSKACYNAMIEFDCASIVPQVALPHSPGNVKPINEIGVINIDQVVIGSCTNGRMEDLRIAAKILRGKKVNSNVRLLILPATPHIYQKAMAEGLMDIFVEAGGTICPPRCGPCFGGSMGLLADGERCVSTTNRNFVGRMGHADSEVYLSGPAVAAASAILGKLAHPEEAILRR
jgi:3-isopropylmalate/(R)-2-methylmalate dehydratase large subunit